MIQTKINVFLVPSNSLFQPKKKITKFVSSEINNIVMKPKKNGIDFMNVDDLKKKTNKAKKVVKNLCKKYNAFLASDSIIRQVPRLLGPHLNKIGKFPGILTHADNMVAKVQELSMQVKFQLKKVLCLGVAVGNVSLTPNQLSVNIQMTVNFLISLLKKGWQNVKTVNIKTTMGKPERIY